MKPRSAPPPESGARPTQSPDRNAIVGPAEYNTAKIAVFKECGIEVAITPSDMAEALLRAAKAKGVTLS